MVSTVCDEIRVFSPIVACQTNIYASKSLVYVPLVTDSGTTTLGAWLLATGSPSLVDLVCDVPNWSNASSNSLVAALKDDHFWKVK